MYTIARDEIAAQHVADLHRQAAKQRLLRELRASRSRSSWKRPWKVDDGIVRIGRARGVRRSRSCVRRLADGPAGACHRSSGRDRGQLLRHWTDPSLRDHLPAPGPRLPDGDCGARARGGHGHGGGRNASFGCAARSFWCEAGPDHRQSRERTGLRGLRIRRPSLASLRVLGRRRRRVRSREHREPGSDPDPGPSGATRLLDRAPPSRSQLRSRQRRDGCGLHRRFRQSPPHVPGALPLRRPHLRCLRAGCARGDPESSPCECCAGERQEQASEQLLTIGSSSS